MCMRTCSHTPNKPRKTRPAEHSQAVGAAPADEEAAAREARALEEVERILAPVKDATWPSGRPENSGLPVAHS